MMGQKFAANASSPNTLSEPESEALWELAEKPGERLWLRYLNEATHDPLRTRQFVARSEPALVAALGLDRLKSDQAVRLLAGHLHESAIPHEQKAGVALVALQLADRPSPDTREWTAVISRAMGNHLLRPGWNYLLADAADRMEPHVACQILTDALRLRHEEDEPLAAGLAAVADTMEPAEAAKILSDAFEHIADTDKPGTPTGRAIYGQPWPPDLHRSRSGRPGPKRLRYVPWSPGRSRPPWRRRRMPPHEALCLWD